MTEEVTFSEIPKDGVIIDIRDGISYDYGHITGAVNIPAENILSAGLSKDKRLYICCRNGLAGAETARELRARGYDAFNLKGGYAEWLKGTLPEAEYGETAKRVDDSLRKKFHKKLFSRFAKAIVEYELIQPGDKIAVCISGGKDSFLMAKLFQELKRHNKIPFEVVFLVMDPGYSRENREIIERNAAALGIPVTVFETDIFESVFNIEKSPCYLCARMRRGHLYHRAQDLGCNKIALGNHYDDVIETILMGMLYGGQMQTMMPKLKSANFAGMELIRPMYYIREEHVKEWRDYNGLHFLQCACKFTEKCSTCSPENGSTRLKVKKIIAELAKDDPGIEQNIFKSVENVSLKTVVAYKDKDGKRHHFLDEY